MKPWTHIASTTVPGGTDLHLWQHQSGFAIRAGHDELMNSRAHASEEALADLASSQQGPRVGSHILIGGLGMGFTAAAALRHLGPDGLITVAELVPAVVDWNRDQLALLNGHALADPRLTIEVCDVADLLRARSAAFDQVLLDVDNGPQGMCAAANTWLYTEAGLACARDALRPGGILAVWSAVPDAAFTSRLQGLGFKVELVRTRAHGKRGAHHFIWLATWGESCAPQRGPPDGQP